VADALIKRVIDERAAACAALSASQTSRYHWQGKIETATEWCITFKTQRRLFNRVAEIIRAQHPYEVPEIIATPILSADPAYAAWVVAETVP
jgi:periplasmic divalent cation tolerance protein